MAHINLDQSAELLMTCRKGNSFELSFTGVQIGGVDITSAYNATMIVRASEGATALLSWETPNEITITTGAIAIVATAANMDVASGVYRYELMITYPDNTEHTWLYGTFIINEKLV